MNDEWSAATDDDAVSVSAANEIPPETMNIRRQWKTTNSPIGGINGDIQRQIDFGGPGITEPLQLTMHQSKTKIPIHIPPSQDKRDFIALDMQAAKTRMSNSNVGERGWTRRTIRAFFRQIMSSIKKIPDTKNSNQIH
jgi:hypothetical protein